MSIFPPDIARYVGAAKTLPFRPRWVDDSGRNGVGFTVPLTTGGVTIGGFELRARVSRQVIDGDALMQLEYAVSTRQRVPLWRCQWRPFETHTNPGNGPAGYEFRVFDGESHHHSFVDNYVPAENRM